MYSKLSKMVFAAFSLALVFSGAMAAPSGPAIANKLEILGQPNENLQVTTIRVAVENDLMRVQAEVANTADRNQQLYYRFKWLDGNGFVVADEEVWKPVLVYGQQKQVIQVVAPSFKASDFRLEMQSPGSASN